MSRRAKRIRIGATSVRGVFAGVDEAGDFVVIELAAGVVDFGDVSSHDNRGHWEVGIVRNFAQAS